MRTFILFFLLVLSKNMVAQTTAITFTRENKKAYLGISNPVIIITEGYNCKDVVVKTGNGTIERTGNCNYEFRPAKTGDAVFTVYNKKGKELIKIDSVISYVTPLPKPKATVGGFSSGDSVISAAFKAQAGVSAYTTYEAHVAVYSFDLVIMKEGKALFSARNNGNAFNSVIREALRTMMDEDCTVLITSILAVGPNQERFKLDPLEYHIK